MSWIAIGVLLLMVWLTMKTISFAIKVALWIAMAVVAYWLFAQAFGLPMPALMVPRA